MLLTAKQTPVHAMLCILHLNASGGRTSQRAFATQKTGLQMPPERHQTPLESGDRVPVRLGRSGQHFHHRIVQP